MKAIALLVKAGLAVAFVQRGIPIVFLTDAGRSWALSNGLSIGAVLDSRAN